MNAEARTATRQRTLLRGTIYYDNRRASVDCVIRDISETGARLTFDHPAVIPDNIELHIPQKQQTLRAHVRRREPNAIGISFEIERALEPRRASDIELQQRIVVLEAEIKAMKRLVAKLAAKVLPNDLASG